MAKKNAAAVELGRLGGQARVPKGIAMLTPEERQEISRKGVAARAKKAGGKGKITAPSKRGREGGNK